MAFQYNPQVASMVSEAINSAENSRRWEVENARAQAEAERRSAVFGNAQEDRARHFGMADAYSDTMGAPTDPSSFLDKWATPGAQPTQPNAVVASQMEAPNAVTQNFATPITQAPQTSGRGDPASATPGLRADLAAQGVRPQNQLDSVGASDAMQLRREMDRTRANIAQARTPRERDAGLAALADMERVYALAQSGYAGAPAEFRANVPMAGTGLAPLAQAPGVQQAPVAQVQAGAMPSAQQAQMPAEPAPRGVMQPQMDPRMGSLKMLAAEAMRQGNMEAANKYAAEYHGLRLNAEMGAVAQAAMQMSPAELNAVMQRMGGDVNTGMRGVLLESKFDPQTHLATLSIGGKKIQVGREGVATIMSGLYAMEKGAVAEGYNRIAAVNKDIATVAAEQNKAVQTAAHENNTAAHYGAHMANDSARTSAYQAGLQSKSPRELSQATVERLNSLNQQITNEGDPSKRKALENEWARVNAQAATEIGKVLQPRQQRVEVDPKALIDTAKYLVESGAKDPDEPAKPLSPQKAMLLARAELSGQPYESAADKQMKAYVAAKQQGAPAPEASPPARGVRMPSVGTLVPPRSGDAARGVAPARVSDEELFIKSMGVAR